MGQVLYTFISFHLHDPLKGIFNLTLQMSKLRFFFFSVYWSKEQEGVPGLDLDLNLKYQIIPYTISPLSWESSATKRIGTHLFPKHVNQDKISLAPHCLHAVFADVPESLLLCPAYV